MGKDPLERLLIFPVGARSTASPGVRAACDAALRGLRARIAILAPARSGSEYLGHLLTRLGIDTREYFNSQSRVAGGLAIGSEEEECAFLLGLCGRVPNGVLSVKGGAHRLMTLVRVGELPRHASGWSFVQLRRRNVVAQALSCLRAMATNAWTSYQVEQRETDCSSFDFDAVSGMIDQIFRAEDAAERFCRVLGAIPLTIYYEDMLEDPDAIVRSVAAHCRLSIDDPTCDMSFAADRAHPHIQRKEDSTLAETAYRQELLARFEQAES